jgi:hypothetical protein
MSKPSATTEHFRQMETEASTAYREWPIFLVRREKHLLTQLAAAKPKPVPPKIASDAPPEPVAPNFIEGIADGTLESNQLQTDERSNQ